MQSLFHRLTHILPHKPGKLILALGLLLCLALCVSPMMSMAAQDKEQASKEDLDKLKAAIEKIQRQLQSDKSSKNTTLNELKKVESRIAKNAKSLYLLQQEITAQDKKLKQLVVQQATLEQQRSTQQLLIEKQILDAYQKGGQNKLKMLLNQENPDELARTLIYYEYFNQARAKQISDYAETLASLQTLTSDIETRQVNLAEKHQLQKTQQSKLQKGRQQRQSTLHKLDKAIHSKDQKLASLKADQKKLEELFASMRDSIQSIQAPQDYRPFKQLKGSMPWPAQGKKANQFGQTRPKSNMRWQGISIQAKSGAPVNAIHHGRVVFANWLRGSGLLIIIDHGGGYMSLYAHNQALLRDVGDWVSTEDVIATVGDSGGRQQAGVYFEVRHNGEPVDPKKWCTRRT